MVCYACAIMIFILILASIGLPIAIYLRTKVGKPGPLACPLGQDCKTVIESKYGHLLGVRNETLGIAYYLFILVASVFWYATHNYLVFPFIFLASAPSALMSIALSGIQIFKLKAYCSWCLAANAINIAIAVISFFPAMGWFAFDCNFCGGWTFN